MRIQPRVFGAVLGTLLLIATVPAALAQPGRPGDDRGMHGPGGRDGARALTEFLKLTEEQREAWIDAHRTHFEALEPTIERIREVRAELRAELESGSPDAATVGGYVISIHELDADVEAARADLEATLREILTDEQETKLEAWKAAHPDRRRGGFDGPPGGGSRRGGPVSGGGAAPSR